MAPDDNNKDGEDNSIEKIFERFAGRVQETVDKFTKGGATQDADGKPNLKGLSASGFFQAIRLSKVEDVKKYIAAKFDLNTYNSAGDTPLHVAARQNSVEIAALLLENGANPRLGRQTVPEHTPLDDAVGFGKPEMVELLARHGGYVPGNRVGGRSLLHRAAEKGKPRIVEALIRAGADANELTDNGTTPLLIAISMRQREVAEALLKFPAVIHGAGEFYTTTDPKKRTAFQIALERGMDTVVEKMLAFGALVNAPDADGVMPLQHAIQRGNIDLVRALVEHGADLNRDTGHGTALHLAASTTEITSDKTRAAIVKFMLSRGADPYVQVAGTLLTPLAAALQFNNTATVAELLKHPVNKELHDREGFTPIYYTVDENSNDMLRQMLKAGANPNARHKVDARTPLIQAVHDKSAEAVKILLEHGANPKLYDAHGKSALSYARATKNEAIVQLLEAALVKAAPKPGKGFSL